MSDFTLSVANLTWEYRKGMSPAKFALLITEHKVNIEINAQTIRVWEKGASEPETDFLLLCLVMNTGLVQQWAIDCLVAKLPEVFERAGLGIRILTSAGMLSMEIQGTVEETEEIEEDNLGDDNCSCLEKPGDNPYCPKHGDPDDDDRISR